jgi:hypothetical protein
MADSFAAAGDSHREEADRVEAAERLRSPVSKIVLTPEGWQAGYRRPRGPSRDLSYRPWESPSGNDRWGRDAGQAECR